MSIPKTMTLKRGKKVFKLRVPEEREFCNGKFADDNNGCRCTVGHIYEQLTGNTDGLDAPLWVARALLKVGERLDPNGCGITGLNDEITENSPWEGHRKLFVKVVRKLRQVLATKPRRSSSAASK